MVPDPRRSAERLSRPRRYDAVHGAVACCFGWLVRLMPGTGAAAVALPLAGGCQCGHVRYQLAAPPLVLYACHCTECQRQSASAFGMSMAVSREALAVEWSRCGTWQRRGASGRTVGCRFCSLCGTRLFHEPSRNPTIVNIKPGSLDDHFWLQPVGHLWTKSKQPWVTIPEGALAYDGQPDDFADLFAAWRRVAENLFTMPSDSSTGSSLS